LEAPPGFEPGVEVLQTSALPLGDGALMNEWLTRKSLSDTNFCGLTLSRTTVNVSAESAQCATVSALLDALERLMHPQRLVFSSAILQVSATRRFAESEWMR
jgi:hypothetical protein